MQASSPATEHRGTVSKFNPVKTSLTNADVKTSDPRRKRGRDAREPDFFNMKNRSESFTEPVHAGHAGPTRCFRLPACPAFTGKKNNGSDYAHAGNVHHGGTPWKRSQGSRNPFTLRVTQLGDLDRNPFGVLDIDFSAQLRNTYSLRLLIRPRTFTDSHRVN